jgi:ribose transport system permease protein
VSAEASTAVEQLSGQQSGRRFDLAAARDYGIVFATVALFVILAVTSDSFLTGKNLSNILFQAAPVGIMACGGTLVFIAGGFDLSVGAVSALAGVIVAKLIPEVGLPVALLLGCLAGLGCGVFNGLAITIGRVNAFIATFASSIMIRGLALAITGGLLITVTNSSFGEIGLGEALGVRYPAYIWLGFALFCGFILSRTSLGRHMYAAGGNAEAARLSGVRVDLVRLTTFAISGLSGALAGILLAAEVSAGQANANTGIEFNAIAAIVIGGTSILGGEGAIWRAVLGTLLFQLISNGFNLLNVEPLYQQIAQGTIMLLAVGIDAWARRTRT